MLDLRGGSPRAANLATSWSIRSGYALLMPRDGSNRVLVSLAPMRLSAPGSDSNLPRSVADDAHEGVVQVSLAWQEVAISARMWELGATTRGTERNRTYALAGQMASVGEQLALAHGAAVEVARWRAYRESAKPDESHEMSMRGMAEAQCLFVIGAGHALANVAVRALALQPDRRAALGAKFKRGSAVPEFRPLSSAREDWVSMSPATSKKIRAVVARDGKGAVAELVQPVIELGLGQAWQSLTDRRGEDFHRWRPQSHGVVGVPRELPWKAGKNSLSMGLGPMYPHEESRGLAEQTAKIATDGMLALAAAMRVYLERWLTTSESVGGPLGDG